MSEPTPPPDADVYRSATDAARLVARHAQPFDRAPDAEAFLGRTQGARVVCLGEATHGTDEFYRIRADLTRALVEEGGVRVVAVEADWPDAERVDAYVRHREPDGRRSRPGEAEWQAFSRFPSWMWRNEPVRDFVEWLRDWNADRPPGDRAGFFGLDLYSLYTSIGEVLAYLDARDPELAADARQRYGCLMPFEGEPADYGRALALSRYDDCRAEVTDMLRGLLQKRIARTAHSHSRAPDDFPYFNAVQNARLVRDAEAYYRESFLGGANTWNLRDGHMTDVLQALLDHFGPDSRAAVWAHNSHLGDAAATQMGARGEVNVGHLSRRIWGDGAYLIGFGTHAGTVFAADDWGRPGRVQTVRPSHPESVEHVCHETGVERFALPLRGAETALRDELTRPRLERAIGVIYRPETERQSHYFPAQLARQFDEWIWIDRTAALVPLGASAAPELPHAHPFRLLGD